jgi:KAP family P-loop domain
VVISNNSRKIILNAFKPGMAIDVPTKFAGRKEHIARLTDALEQDGVVLAIYGERGLGKSSLAAQIERIALGDVELLQNIGLGERAIDPMYAFATFNLQCTDDLKTKDHILQRLVNQSEGQNDLASLPNSNPESKTITEKISLKFYEYQVANTYQKRGLEQQWNKYSSEEKLIESLKFAINSETRRVLVIIDEIDRVESIDGLSSFIKSHTSPDLRFCIVGIANNVSSLIGDHESLERLLCPAHIKKMQPFELREIIDLVEKDLFKHGIDITFELDAKMAICRNSGGYPWFVHVIGNAALLAAHENGQRLIKVSDIESAIKSLAENNFARRFEEVYKKAVGDSESREIVLRLFASWSDLDVPTSQIYPKAKLLGISNPSQAVRHLTQANCGKILVKASYASGLYMFRNAMFKQYVNLRTSWFNGVADRVNDVTQTNSNN